MPHGNVAETEQESWEKWEKSPQTFKIQIRMLWGFSPAYLGVVLHHTADLLHHVDASLTVQGIDQLSQVRIAVTDGPVLQRSIRPLVVRRVTIGEGRHFPLSDVGQGLVHIYPLGSHLGCHYFQDIHPWTQREDNKCMAEGKGAPSMAPWPTQIKGLLNLPEVTGLQW